MTGITFGNKHSYNDWDLILTDVQVSPPEPKRYTVEVPGADGIIDVTSALTSRIKFNNRTIKYVFQWKDADMDFASKLATVMGYLHGQKLHVTEDGSTDYFWDGFCTVESFSGEGHVGQITVNVDAYPYRYKSADTVKTRTGDGTLNCTNGRMPVCPKIANTADATIVFGSTTYSLSASTEARQISGIVLEEGDNNMTITTDGTVTVTYREGSL